MLRTRVKAGPIAGLVLSAVAAAILTAVQFGDLYVSAFDPKYGAETTTAIRVPYGPRVSRDVTTGRAELRFEHERLIIAPGTRLRTDLALHRAAFAYESSRRPPRWPRIAGMFVIFFTLSMGMTAYLRKFAQNRLRLLRTQVGVFVALGLLALVAKGLLLWTAVPEYWIPVAAVPLWVATSFDRKTAFLVAVVVAFIVASLLRFDLMLLTVMLTVGLGATLLYLDRKRSRHMVLSGGLAGLSAAALLVAVNVAVEGRFELMPDLTE